VATWENLGSSALDVTQGTAGAQPTFRTSIVGDNPVVRCDGGDRVAGGLTPANWLFLSDGSDWTGDAVAATSSANPNALYAIYSTTNLLASAGNRGSALFGDDRSSVPANERVRATVSTGSALIIDATSADAAWPTSVFSLVSAQLDDDGGAGNDLTIYVNNSSVATFASSGAYSASNPIGVLNLCAAPGGASPLSGDLFRVVIYQSALTATQRGINKAVDEWALGGTLPVTP